MHQLWQYWAVFYLVSTQHISVPAETQGCTPEKHIMRSDGKSCLVSDMNSIHPFFHVRQYSQKELMLTCFNFADTENFFSSVGAFSFHLKKKKSMQNNIIRDGHTQKNWLFIHPLLYPLLNCVSEFLPYKIWIIRINAGWGHFFLHFVFGA